MKRTRVVAGRTMLVTAAVAVGLAGCSVLSPATVIKPYAAADGVGLDLPGGTVSLRNFLVVGTAKGKPAAVVGTVVNDGPTDVQVGLQSDLGATAQPTQTVVEVDAHSAVQVGPGQKVTMVIPQLPVDPGSVTAISAATQSGGRADVDVPVLLPQGEYSSLTPSPTPSETATETPENSATPSADSTTSSKKKKSKTTSTAEPTTSATTS